MLSNQTPGGERAARVRDAQLRAHANALATWRGGEPFGVIFVLGSRGAFGEVATGSIACSLSLAFTPGLDQGDELVIDGARYEVAEPVQPDASGWVALQLRTLEEGVGHG